MATNAERQASWRARRNALAKRTEEAEKRTAKVESKLERVKEENRRLKRLVRQFEEERKRWIPGSDVSASNPKTGNTRMKGTIAQRGPQYGGGGRNTQ